MAEIENKFIVINRKHLYSDKVREIGIEAEEQVLRLQKALQVLNKHDILPKHTYYVCNADEPYAPEVLKIIMEGEDKKKIIKGEPICYKCKNFDVMTRAHRAGNICRKNHFSWMEEEPTTVTCSNFEMKEVSHE